MEDSQKFGIFKTRKIPSFKWCLQDIYVQLDDILKS